MQTLPFENQVDSRFFNKKHPNPHPPTRAERRKAMREEAKRIMKKTNQFEKD